MSMTFRVDQNTVRCESQCCRSAQTASMPMCFYHGHVRRCIELHTRIYTRACMKITSIVADLSSSSLFPPSCTSPCHEPSVRSVIWMMMTMISLRCESVLSTILIISDFVSVTGERVQFDVLRVRVMTVKF